MEYFDNSLESIKIQFSHLDLNIKNEESHVWKNLIRIEELKKEKLHKKNAQMRQNMQKITLF